MNVNFFSKLKGGITVAILKSRLEKLSMQSQNLNKTLAKNVFLVNFQNYHCCSLYLTQQYVNGKGTNNPTEVT